MDDARPKMCVSRSSQPPPPKAIPSFNLTLGYEYNNNNKNPSVPNREIHCQNYKSNNNFVYRDLDNMQRQGDIKNVKDSQVDEDTSSDYKQWLHAMKLVARLPGGIPPEFRRKLWLSLADKYLKSKNVDWTKEEVKCFCEKWREDDEELGIQIVKDLHRTGSTLCTGPAGDLNQAKLKKILLGYARYNPEVGYCQGFNMLGALILQVMDKDESESIKVMIYLVEGILPTGYFCGSMGGLQADMAVFRELMQTKLPRLAKHLQKLQGPVENAFEPPLTNVFTMQWFLTMFCTCLPMSCVLRVWDLVLIEGSDVLLRTALALWSLLEERVLSARSADDFYGKMGSFSSELLNGHLIDSNGLIEKVVQLGPIADIQKLRDKHLYSIAPIQNPQGLQLYYDDDEPEIDEDSRLAVATVWGIPWGRRGSQGQTNNVAAKQAMENKDRIALDISLLKKQYDRLRERQKQAHIILTTACSTASRHNPASTASNSTLPVNQLLSGRPAIITNKGRRSGPLTGAIPPARKPSLPAVLHDKPLEKQLKRGETLHWRDTKDITRRRDSLSWKEIKAERAAMISSGSIDSLKSQKIRTGRLGKSDSSSYSEESDDNEVAAGDASSTDTSLCDDDLQPVANGLKQDSRIEISQQKSSIKTLYKPKKKEIKQRIQSINLKENMQKARPKSWAPSNSEIPFMLMTTESPNNSADENTELDCSAITDDNTLKYKADVQKDGKQPDPTQPNLNWNTQNISPIAGDIEDSNLIITSNNGISVPTVIGETITILKSERLDTDATSLLINSTNSLGDRDAKVEDQLKSFDISKEGVTNKYFERVNSSERPTKLDLLYSLNDDEDVCDAFKTENVDFVKLVEESPIGGNDKKLNSSKNIRCMEILVDYSEKSSAACIEEAKTEISTTFHTSDVSNPISSPIHSLKKPKGSLEKRRDPRRLTLTRSSTMDIEKRYQALEKRLSMEIGSKYKQIAAENELYLNAYKSSDINSNTTKSVCHYNDSKVIDEELLPKGIGAVVNKKIPSTADLEERFRNLQQQLVRDKKSSLKSPCDSESTDQQTKMSSSSHNDATNRIPQNNKSKKPSKNEDDTKNETGKGEGTTLSGLPEVEKSSPTSINNKETDIDSSIESVQKRAHEVSSSTNPKINELQTKKEPPDDNADMKITTSDNKDDSQSPKDDKKLENDGETNEDHSKENTSKQPPENREPSNEIHESPASKSNRTSPPSTEELEKRFSALEEQLNSSKNDSSDKLSVQNKNHNNSEDIFENQDEQINETSAHKPQQSGPTVSDLKTHSTKFKETSESSTKRRLSEPPSTEDLEKRYEVLKRRMSTRNFEGRTLTKDEIAERSQQAHRMGLTESSCDFNEKESSKHSTNKPSPPTIENLEERYEKLQSEKVSKSISVKKSPPSTENLEKRFEKLQSKADIYETERATESEEKETENIGPEGQNDDENNAHFDTNEDLKNKSLLSKESANEVIESNAKNYEHENKKSNENNKVEVQGNEERAILVKTETLDTPSHSNDQIKLKLIEELQAKIKEHSGSADVDRSVKKKMALIEELKMKIKPLPGGFLKPTQISSSRRTPAQIPLLPSKSFNDETLESHATSAYRRSGKYEPSNSANRKMVRRFSDLPSRADLENRLQFLEEELSKTVCMQRRSSDSEVASKGRNKSKLTASNVPLSESLEYRVQELEKRLNGNKTLTMDIGCSNAKQKNKNDTDVEISQIELATDSVAVTGKELVRYSSYGEVGEFEHQNPINISINIQMTLNKDDCVAKQNIDNVSKTDDLDKRLQYLEQQLKSQVNESPTNIEADAKELTNEKCQKINAEEIEVTHKIKETDLQEDTRDSQETNTENESNLTEIKTDNLDKTTEINCCTERQQDRGDSQECKDKDDTLSQVNQVDEVPDDKYKMQENPSDEDKKSPPQFAKEDNLSQNNVENRDAEIKNEVKTEVANTNNNINENERDLQPKTVNSTNDTKEATKPDALSKSNKDIESPKTSKQSEGTFENEKRLSLNEGLPKQFPPPEEIEKSNTGVLTQFVPVEVNKKTLVLLLDNEPKAVKVRRLTRANTEELEDLFQALEKQLNDRGHEKSIEKKSETKPEEISQIQTETAKAMSDLTKEIEEEFSKKEVKQLTQSQKPSQKTQKEPEENFDWGNDPIKYHLKKRTVYLPSTRELEARFRSLERQIKLLEDVEKIDVEQRLIEIERKIKLQYSLSHEKDLNKFLELCEGNIVEDDVTSLEKSDIQRESRKEVKSQQKVLPKHKSPTRVVEPIPTTGNLEYRYRSLDLKRSKSNPKKQPIHPLEMLLDPSPDESAIPTTGELEHRIRVMEENLYTPSPPSRKSRSQSPPSKSKEEKTKTYTHPIEAMTMSPTERELPTAEELEARLEALEREQCFNFKMQKNFQQFNQKLKDVVSPSLSLDEFKSPPKTCEPVSSKSIRFREEEQPKQSPILREKESLTVSDPYSNIKGSQQKTKVDEGLANMGIRLMRETSPLRRKGTHTGVPLRTGENINDQLTSIQNTIKSIDSLCEEKPYRKERCQQYIDSLFSDSTYFAHKKASLEDLTSRNLSRSISREIGPSIRISDHSPAYSRSMGSADSIRSSSPLRSASPLQYRSNRDLRREPSPRRRRDEDREEHESRVRRDNLLPNNINYSHSILSHTSHSSLTKFHKVDSQLIPKDVENELDESLRNPSFSSIDNLKYHDNINTSNNVNTAPQLVAPTTTEGITPEPFKGLHSDRPISPFRQSFLPTTNTPVYTPSKLEIRHTTVTSTFYDRVLTEKQLEKQQQHYNSVPANSQSPMISPMFERHIKPSFQPKQQTNKSPQTNLNTDPLILTDASTGNYQHHHGTYQPHIQANNHA